MYTVAKYGALVVWECSMTLTEMQDYIKKTTMKDEEEEGGRRGKKGNVSLSCRPQGALQ